MKASMGPFVAVMVAKLALRSRKYGDEGWKNRPVARAREHLLEEIEEWQKATTVAHQRQELVDIANTAFILWERLGHENSSGD